MLSLQKLLNEIPKVTENRNKADNASVEKFQKEVKQLLDEFETADTEKKAKLIPQLVQLAEKMAAKGLQNARAIKKS